jgi:hypothetical protein
MKKDKKGLKEIKSDAVNNALNYLDEVINIRLTRRELMDGLHIKYILTQREVFKTIKQECNFTSNACLLILLNMYYLEKRTADELPQAQGRRLGINRHGFLTYNQIMNSLVYIGQINLYKTLYWLSDNQYLNNLKETTDKKGNRVLQGYKLSASGHLVIKRYIDLFKSLEIINPDTIAVNKKIKKAVEKSTRKNTKAQE